MKKNKKMDSKNTNSKTNNCRNNSCKDCKDCKSNEKSSEASYDARAKDSLDFEYLPKKEAIYASFTLFPTLLYIKITIFKY